MRRIYLDTNILVAYYASDEADKKGLVERALAAFESIADVELCTSTWTVTEMISVLIKTKKMERGSVAEIAEAFQRRKRLRSLKVCFVEVSPQKNYDFDDFFCDVGDGVLSYRSHLADVIHSVIAKNNEITHILTFDENTGFKEIPGLKLLHPKDITLQEV